MKIGELARITGVSTSSIRFYEKHGLIPIPERAENGYRDYPDETVSRITTIAMSKSLGFSLSEIRRIVPNDPRDHIERADVVSHLEDKLVDVDKKMRDLRDMRKKLQDMLKYMKTPGASC